MGGLSVYRMRDCLTYQVSMLLRTNPQMSVTPFAQLSELLNFGVKMLNIILDG